MGVELSGAAENGVDHTGRLGNISSPFEPSSHCYTVKIKSEGKVEDGRTLMAEEYGVDDLFSMSQKQMEGLWQQFGLSCKGLRGPDAFIEQAMTFLPPVRPDPVIFSARVVHPVIFDAQDVLLLESLQRNSAKDSRLQTL